MASSTGVTCRGAIVLRCCDSPMEHSFDPLAVITMLGAAQGILLALALLGLKKGRLAATRLLAAFMAVTSFAIIGSILVSTKYILVYPHLVQLTTPLHFLFGPLIFLYISISTTRKSLRRLDFLHFLPFLLCAAYYFNSKSTFNSAFRKPGQNCVAGASFRADPWCQMTRGLSNTQATASALR